MIEVFGRVKDGKIQLPKDLSTWISTVFNNKEIRVIVKEFRYKRSNRQNRYYWGVVIPHVVAGFVATGNTWLNPANKEHQEMVHDILKDRFLANGEQVVMPDGTSIRTKSSTSNADTLEFTDYIERVRAFAIESMGITIPDPGEIYAED